MAVRVDLNISLDGVAAPADPTPENPMGADWDRLVADYMATRTFRARVFGDTSGAGTTGVDDHYAAAYFEGIGAEVMGAAMFGLHSFPDDPDWRGCGRWRNTPTTAARSINRSRTGAISASSRSATKWLCWPRPSANG